MVDILYRAAVNKSLWIEQDDRWILNLQGLTVTEIGVSYRLSLRIDADISVSLGSPCMLSDDVGASRQETRLDPEWQDVVPALALFNDEVLSAVALKTGALQLVFGSGTQLTCDPIPSYEAWQVSGPGGHLMVCLPSGGLAVWPADS
ncbi:hypothetical protein ABIA32_005321 [Streptacidiphilus sp. MAP12-20]